MSLVAGVEDGKIVTSTSQSSLADKVSGKGSNMDKDSFLQLLVAQMKYQDPLEPTSNTEYIAQYAQFTQVEEMQNMSSSMDLMRASALVGKDVYMKVTSATTGETNYVQGKVDYVVYENGKAYLSINESLYSIDDLDTVVDGEYLTAYDMATQLCESINKLPSVKNIDLGDEDKIMKLKAIYDEMSEYQKSFVASDMVTTLNSYVNKIEELKALKELELKKQEEAAKQENQTGNTSGETGNVEGTGSVEGGESTDSTGSENTEKPSEETGNQEA